ncbi:hypothetical protein [Marinicella sp. W31]|uniref:hypothetical protein n=1 Tax=Marinicella sp. W31 TaxID=3023713 RepID=UPI00375820D2
MMKRIFMILCLLSVSLIAVAQELPSWGVTKEQFQGATGKNKLNEIGKEASQKKWRLIVSAPRDWHSGIRKYITKDGSVNVNISFKDTVYESISILAAKNNGANAVTATPSSQSQNAVRSKQVVVDKPDIEVAVEAPDVSNISVDAGEMSSDDVIGVDLSHLKDAKIKRDNRKDTRPLSQRKFVENKNRNRPVAGKKQAPKVEAPEPTPEPAKPQPVTAVAATSSTDDVAATARAYLQKEYARNDGISHSLSRISSLKKGDYIYTRDNQVLIKRFLSNNIHRFYWLETTIDLTAANLKKVSDERYRVSAPFSSAGEAVVESQPEKPAEPVMINTAEQSQNDQKELRSKHARNQTVKVNIMPEQLRKGDLLFVRGQTVLVKRDIGRGIFKYFWLTGEFDLSAADRTSENAYKVKNDPAP